MSKYEQNLDKNEANFVSLSPLSFMRRAAEVFPQRIALIHGEDSITWSETFERCRRLSSALKARGIKKGDTVAIMAPNVPALFESHFGVPASGAVLNALNTRLDSTVISFILEHAEARVLITDKEFSPVISEALQKIDNKPLVVDIDDSLAESGELLGDLTYEELLSEGDANSDWVLPEDEWDAISLNYTSGTTGNPKGVVYHHRGAYMNAIGNLLAWGMSPNPIYLWTLPMFHCNGWCFPWTIAALSGTNVCLRGVQPSAVFKEIMQHRVTHMCGAPIVMNMLLNAPESKSLHLNHRIKMMTAGAAPPAAVLEKMEELGFDITHTYGLTEVYGPVTVCDWHEEWDEKSVEERAFLKARQGVKYAVQEEFFVADPESLQPVPADGETMGELFFKGNVVMKGYLKNPKATQDSFQGGFFHTGDLGVTHPDGYVEIRDRSKDIIISGGENISSIEVEGVLYRHPAILEAAIVARPDDHWGETPCAFVTLKDGETASEQEIIQFCRSNMAHYKCPKTVIFTNLPKTSTGKIQKFVLRDRANNLSK
ncbi:MAG: acyl-CoA synthetase [Rhodospirillaceae bacterium]|nr:acyl-CoA synthetase [Rhodospirillaceae bacterium]|tara:strand:+ start:1476 stop:3101 length:1626 start_codon:yes stop_codon:yes gene_type:complete